MGFQKKTLIKMPDQNENENVLSRRLNKVLETRFENDQVKPICFIAGVLILVFDRTLWKL